MPSPDGKPDQQKYGAQYKLIGKDYTTPDLYAKVTGKQNMRRTFAPRACCSANCCSVPCRMGE